MIGMAAALATFFSVWFGHVAVRKVEYAVPVLWPVVALFAATGLAAQFAALLMPSPLPSGILGILGIVLCWDAFEFVRQQRRVQKGHAPANPVNPRHARILADFPHATTQDAVKSFQTASDIVQPDGYKRQP